MLGTCNAHFAWRALLAEDKVGALSPCNVIVTETAPGTGEVAAADPVTAMGIIANPRLTAISEDVQQLLQEVIVEL